MQPAIRIVEVGPRDGLQNIQQDIPTHVKVDLIKRLHDAGLRDIELTSFVSPKAVPQLKDGYELVNTPSIQSLLQDKLVRLPVLVPNVKGARLAAVSGVKHIAVFLSASEGFSRANINCTTAEGLSRASVVARIAKEQGLELRGLVMSRTQTLYQGKMQQQQMLTDVPHIDMYHAYSMIHSTARPLHQLS